MRKAKRACVIPRRRKRAALSSALAVFLAFTLTFSSFAWGAANDASDVAFTDRTIDDIPADETQGIVADGSISAVAVDEDGTDGEKDTESFGEIENIPYIDANGDRVTLPAGVSATVVVADDTVWTDGWYIVNSDVTIPERITTSGNVNLILGNGYTFTASKGIQVGSGASLGIYAQSASAGSMGSLVANVFSETYVTAIGGSNTEDCGSIIINGGAIHATGGRTGAAIGGGSGRAGGTIQINGGIVTALAGTDGAGIGGGGFGGTAGTITINGGTVNATGGQRSAAIGGGSSGNGGAITINGGTVNATGGDYSCAIGGGISGAGGNITINGGSVSARSVSVECAAIGGANKASGGTIALNGGFIDAQGVTPSSGGDIGPGIGDGEGGTGCTLSTAANGNAFITTNRLNGNEGLLTSCIYFIGTNGYVRGDQTLIKDLHLNQGQYLYTSTSGVLRVPAGITLTNDGILFDRGELVNNGAIVNNGGTRVLSSAKLTNNGAFTNNGTLEVLGTLESSGTIEGTGTFSGNKAAQAAPAAPQKQSATESSVTLAPMTTGGNGNLQYGYSLSGVMPLEWQTSNTFTGLNADTTYTFFARYDGNDYFEPAASVGTNIATAAKRSGHVENVTDASTNYLGADFVLPGDAVADAILPAYACQQLELGKDVDIWMESNRITDSSAFSAAQDELGEFLPAAYFDLTSYWQVEGETPVQAATETRDDATVMVRLKLSDSAINTDPTITREYKVICVSNGVATTLITRYDPDSQTVEFRTNRFASFCLACKDTRDGKTVYPVMVQGSYAQDSGQGQYAAGDTVMVNAGVRNGYMVEFWNGAPSDKIDFTIIDSSHASFIMPDSAVMVSPQWVRIGEIRDVTDVNTNALHAKLVNSGVDLAERVLPADAFAQLPAMKDVDIWLRSVDGISEKDVAIVADNFGDWTLADEVDLTLFYKMDGAEMRIHETNKPVTLQLTLPDSIINTDPAQSRSFEVVRVHEGVASVIPASLDTSAKTLTFETDKFSAYAIIYQDVPTGASGDDGSESGDLNSGTPDSGGSANSGSDEGNVANSDNAAGLLSAMGDNIGAFVALFLCMIGGAVGLLGVRHRKMSSVQRGKHVAHRIRSL